MLVLLFLYYLLQDVYIDAGPIPTAKNRSLAENHCTDLTHCLTIWEIVWSCLVTIFSRTWVAVHLRRNEKLLLSFAEHLLSFVCALLVPAQIP